MRDSSFFAALILMWVVLISFLGFTSYCNRATAYQHSIVDRTLVFDVNDEEDTQQQQQHQEIEKENVDMADDYEAYKQSEKKKQRHWFQYKTFFDIKKLVEGYKNPQSSSSSSSSSLALCKHWNQHACRHLESTAKALDNWRLGKAYIDIHEKNKRAYIPLHERKPVLEIDSDNNPGNTAAEVKLWLRGQHFRSWWWHVIPKIAASAEAKCPVPCRIFSTRPEEADVVVDTLNVGLPLPNPTTQKLALLALETSSKGTHSSENLVRTDILISWLRNSDVPINYMYAWQNLCVNATGSSPHHPYDIENCMAPVPTPEELARKRLGAAFVSNCAAKDRMTFMQALFQELKKVDDQVQVDNLGKCATGITNNNNKLNIASLMPMGYRQKSKATVIPNSGQDAKRGIEKIQVLEPSYKFAFAFENSIREDYVTEKALHPILASTIPVIWGAPRACDFLPGPNGKGCINALDFASPADLAKYLVDLDRNDTAYLEHFSWRRSQGGKGASETFLAMQDHSFTMLGEHSWPCRLCQFYHHEIRNKQQG